MQRRVIIIAAFLAVVSLPATGEDAVVGERDLSGAIFFTMGFTKNEKGDLGTSLRNSGFGRFGDKNLYLGAGGYFLLDNNLLLGGSGGGVIPAAETDDYKTRLYAAHLTFDAGYAFLRKRYFVAYPFGGLGIGGARLTLTDNDPPDDFNDYLDGTFHTATLFRLGVAMKAGGGFEVRVPLTDRGFSLVFGTRGGYVYMPWASDWYFESTGAGNEPDYRYGGPYVVGFAGVSPF
ncbi:MAG: hypothetical protein JSW52_08690 [Candidatus Coatesbacteria bacterium]|nr:MAG: hypothetical protein JSW52_08690 [Candidatus Coatesbacteria bacterium]